MARRCTARVKRTQSVNALVMGCKNCDGKGELSYSECLANVLEHYMSEFNIDSVVLSGYMERQYEGSAIRLLERLSGLAETLEQLSARNPVREYFMGSGDGEEGKDERQKVDDPGCAGCALNPQSMFAELREQLMGGISEFYKSFVHQAQQVERGKGKQCAQCIFHTGNDIIFLHNQMAELRRFIIYEGFQIVLD